MKINQELRTGLDKRNANQKTTAAGAETRIQAAAAAIKYIDGKC
jgi:hypothetical protein